MKPPLPERLLPPLPISSKNIKPLIYTSHERKKPASLVKELLREELATSFRNSMLMAGIP